CLLACGCSSQASPASGVPDAAAGADGSEGGAGDDAGSTAFLDAAPPEGGMLQAGDSLSVRQVTSDGFVVYSDDAAGELYAVPLSGGSAQHIASLGGTFGVTGDGQGAEPMTIVAGADAVMALSPARDFIVYSWSAQAGPNAGIFVPPVP